MKIAIIGASGKLGTKLVQESLRRGYQVVAVCRQASVDKLDEFAGRQGFTIRSGPEVSDEEALTGALKGCDAVVVVLISVRRLKATGLVISLAKASSANGVKRLVFTAGEVTAVPEAGESFTRRQKFLDTLGRLISLVTPYSMPDMIRASTLIRQQPDWDWTIVRAPTLQDKSPAGYRFTELSAVTSAHSLSREDYAACLLDILDDATFYRQTLTVVPAK